MLAQAAGLALLAAVSPTALLVASVYLGSARPRQTALSYLAGAVLMTVVMAVTVVVALRLGHLDLRRERTPRYGLRFTLGLLIIAAAAVLARRRPRAPDPSKPPRGLVARLVARPGPKSAAVTGMAVFAPSLTFIAAVQVIGTARVGLPLVVLAIVMVTALNVAFVWLPLLAHLAAPEPTSRLLTSFNAWLRAHGRLVMVAALAVAGTFLVLNGLAGLSSPVRGGALSQASGHGGVVSETAPGGVPLVPTERSPAR